MSEDIKKVDQNAEADAKLEEKEELLKNQKALRRAERRMRDLEWFGLRALVFVIVIWVLFFYVVGFATMQGQDMYPRIDGNDLTLFYRLDKDVKAQDIIVFNKNGQRYISRVIAVAGDTVEITDSERLIINGSTMLESNIFYSTPRYEGFTEYPITLGEDECFVLADHRQGGEDSRYFGPVKKSEIAGTVISVLRRNNL